MERFTTNASKYFCEIKKELLDIGVSGNHTLRFTYCEIGQLLSHAFSVSYFVGEQNYLLLKKWNAEYDNNRFRLNIYNIGRLAITENYLKLTNNNLLKINSLLSANLDIIDMDSIIVDGLYCQLKYNDVTLNWNTDNEMNNNLSGLISFIRNIINIS